MVVTANPTREAAAEDQTLGAFGVRCGEKRRQGAALRPSADDGAVDGFLPHHGDQVPHPVIEGRRWNVPVGGSGAALVEVDHPAGGAELF